MRKNIEPLSWQSDLAAFGKRNNMRPARLEVLGPVREVESDFWLEDGLLLAGIDLETDGERGTCIDIMLQAPSASSQNHMTHTVAGVKRLGLETTDGRDKSLEIEDGEGGSLSCTLNQRILPNPPGRSKAMRVILVALLLIIPLSTKADAQTQTFTREGVEYVLDLPSPSWRAVSRVDVHEHLEFVNGEDYSRGYLRLRKKVVTPDTTPKDLFSEAEKWELQKLAGYVVCSGGTGTEFSGQLKGTVFSYEFVNQGRNMEGRIYYLRLDSRTFFILHFTVASEKLLSLRDQMDSVAKSFRLK